MQYPLLVSLVTLILLLAVVVISLIFFLLLKRWVRTDYFTAIKALGLYWLIAILTNYLLLSYLKTTTTRGLLSLVVEVLAITTLLYIIFHSIVKKFFSLKIKQSVLLFIVIVLVSSFLGFFQNPVIEMVTQRYEPFMSEKKDLDRDMREMMDRGDVDLFEGDTSVSLHFKIVGLVDRGVLNWPASYSLRIFRELMWRGGSTN